MTPAQAAFSIRPPPHVNVVGGAQVAGTPGWLPFSRLGNVVGAFAKNTPHSGDDAGAGAAACVVGC